RPSCSVPGTLFTVADSAPRRYIMLHLRFASLLLIVSLAGMSVVPIWADKPTEPDKKQPDPVQKIQQLLNEDLVETKHFQKEMPLGELLRAVEKQLPKDKKMALRIDAEAFGDKRADLTATTVKVTSPGGKTSLRRVLDRVVARSKTPANYRLD